MDVVERMTCTFNASGYLTQSQASVSLGGSFQPVTVVEVAGQGKQ